MKKTLSLIILFVMSLTLLAGCGDPLYDDFDNFLNVEMKGVNENYEKIQAEAATWETLEDEAALAASISDVMLPLVEDSLAQLENINPQTEEVQALKDQFVAIMTAYQEGFNEILVGIQELDEEKMLAGNDKVTEGLNLVGEYNASLEALADEVGCEIEY